MMIDRGGDSERMTDGAQRAASQAERRLSKEDDARLRDPRLVPGSKHYATMLAFGTFELADGGSVFCDGVQGVSAVTTAEKTDRRDGRTTAALARLLTHFDWPDPPVLIEQNPYRASHGTLTSENGSDLLPGTATFSQLLILTLNGRPLVNPEPLVMTARGVTRWPPVGAVFESERATEFYEVGSLPKAAALADPDAFAGQRPVAALTACAAPVIGEVLLPTAQELAG